MSLNQTRIVEHRALTLGVHIGLIVLLLSYSANAIDSPDWLLEPQEFRAELKFDATKQELTMQNGLVRRIWRVQPNAACVSFDNLMTDQAMLRSIRPEARATIDGQESVLGGLEGQPNHAYLKAEWIDSMKPIPGSWQMVDWRTSEIETRLVWKEVRHHDPNINWPPKGVHLELDFERAESTSSLTVRMTVHYEMYDGIPLISKWLSLHNATDKTLTIDRITTEELALVEHSNWVEDREGVFIPHPDYLHAETDFAFGGFNHQHANRHVVHWLHDPLYATQVNYLQRDPCLFVSRLTHGPAQDVLPGLTFVSHRTFELIYDSTDRERRGLSLRRMMRTVSPWVTENPLMHHLRISDPASVKRAIDDAKDVGFEMIILSFGSGFDIENTTPEYLEGWKQLARYAHEQGVELGGYSLLSSRKVGGGNDIVSPDGQQPAHGSCPALTSEWAQGYFSQLRSFLGEAEFDVLEHDGPYPGDIDVVARPPLQKGEQDSQWVQGQISNGLYRWCRERGIYLNTPDYYYMSGSNKCGMGYREVNWSLPREQQLIHTRQNIFDGTWEKTPSMGWMFVPLSEYHGGGEAATIEPLDKHRDHYRRMMMANLGMGVQACYRGPRLFDTPATRVMVKSTVDWFKKYRNILESDIIHGRRADGREIDWALHVNPMLEVRGMLVAYNPCGELKKASLRVPLYYTGLDSKARVSHEDQNPLEVQLARDYSIQIAVEIPAYEMTWFVIR